eukprot:54886-Pelagomonas_calceolata.AAC.1
MAGVEAIPVGSHLHCRSMLRTQSAPSRRGSKLVRVVESENSGRSQTFVWCPDIGPQRSKWMAVSAEVYRNASLTLLKAQCGRKVISRKSPKSRVREASLRHCCSDVVRIASQKMSKCTICCQFGGKPRQPVSSLLIRPGLHTGIRLNVLRHAAMDVAQNSETERPLNDEAKVKHDLNFDDASEQIVCGCLRASTTVCEGTSGLSAALSVYSWVSHCGAPQARWPAHGCKHLSCMFIAISNQWHSANEAASCAPEFDKFLMQNIAKVSAMEMIGQRSWDEALAGGKEDHREGPQTDKLQEPDQEDEEDEYEDEPQLQAGSPAEGELTCLGPIPAHPRPRNSTSWYRLTRHILACALAESGVWPNWRHQSSSGPFQPAVKRMDFYNSISNGGGCCAVHCK